MPGIEPMNPLDPQLAVDPYPTYARLRGEDPVHLTAFGVHALTRHADVTTVLRDTVTFRHCYVAQQTARVGAGVEDEPYFGYLRRMAFVLDDPDHRRVRRLLQGAFTPARVNAMRTQTVAIANELVDAHAGARAMDVVADFAFPLPMRVIGTILGIPVADHALIGTDATALNPVLEFLPMSPEVLTRANEAVQALAAHFGDLAEARRREPTDDLFSAMVHAAVDGERLTKDELIANAILLYIAGHETTAGATGLALLALHRNPDQFALLKARPDLIPAAADELLRYDSPGQGTARVLTADATFSDTTLPAGSMVLAYLGAANRDGDVYPQPDRLDIERDFTSQPKPATWGGGAHLCLGRALALQEMEAMLEVFTQRCPDLTVDSFTFRPTPLMRGLEHLHIHWQAGRASRPCPPTSTSRWCEPRGRRRGRGRLRDSDRLWPRARLGRSGGWRSRRAPAPACVS